MSDPTTDAPSGPRVFISYAWEDDAHKAWVRRLAAQLREDGVLARLDVWDRADGQSIAGFMTSEVEDADKVLVVCSPGYKQRADAAERGERMSGVGWEWDVVTTALFQGGDLARVVAVRARGAFDEAVPLFLKRQPVFDLTEGADLNAEYEQLFTCLTGQEAHGPPVANTLRQIDHPPTVPLLARSSASIHHMPHRRNPNFTGREDLLEQLHSQLAAGTTTALTQAQAIHGLGGIGKTQLALEYSYRYADEYALIWWLMAETPTSLASSWASLAERLFPNEAGAWSPEQQRQAINQWLAGHPGWLLVFDNALDAQSIEADLPRATTGQVLITSRDPNWGSVAQPLPVAIWPRSEAVDFLLRRTGQDDTEAADQVAAAVGDLPLALEHAGAYVGATGLPLSRYVDRFTNHRQALWENAPVPTGYHATITTTWSLALVEIDEADSAAGELLTLCAFLASEALPYTALAETQKGLPDRLAKAVVDPLNLDQLIGLLRRYALVQAEGETLSMHRLVQAVIMDRLREDDHRDWSTVAVEWINVVFPFESNFVETWELSRAWLPHALQAADRAEQKGVAPQATGWLLNKVGNVLRLQAFFGASRQALERALAIDTKAYGLDHPDVAVELNDLGLVLQDQGDLTQAREYFERALAINTKAYGPDHLTVAIVLNNLGLVLRTQGDFSQAREYFERALAIGEEVLSPDHSEVAIWLSNLGLVLRAQGDLSQAHEHLERAVAISLKTYGPDHPDVAATLNNLGLVLQDQSDLSQAREHLERALEISESSLGLDHPDVATALNNLAGVLRDQGDLSQAREHYERSLEISESSLGPDHPDVATTLTNLAGVLQDQGDLSQAREHYERSLEISESSLGPDHPDVATTLTNLAGVLRDQGDLSQAREHYEHSLEISESSLGPDHPDVATTLTNLASVLQDQGDLSQARQHYERALAIGESSLGPDHPDVATTLNNLAGVLRAQGDLSQARQHYERALEIFQKTLGEAHPHTQAVRRSLDALH